MLTASERTTWRTREGATMSVFDMETDHIIACVAMIKRTGWRIECLEMLEQELRDRDHPDADLGDKFALTVHRARTGK